MTEQPVQYLLTSAVGHPFPEFVRDLIAQRSARSVCDMGGGANPILSLEEIASMGLRYVLADVSTTELAKAAPATRRARWQCQVRASTSGASRSTL